MWKSTLWWTAMQCYAHPPGEVGPIGPKPGHSPRGRTSPKGSWYLKHQASAHKANQMSRRRETPPPTRRPEGKCGEPPPGDEGKCW